MGAVSASANTNLANGATLKDVSSILGANPSYKFMLLVSEAVHETPVYLASQNKLHLPQLAPPPGYLPQLVMDLNKGPPILSEYLSDPPVYAPNGCSNRSIRGGEQRVSLRTLDPETNKSVTLVNNYFGYYFNTIDDLVFNAPTGSPPQLPSVSYRYNTSSGAIFVVDDSIGQPNGIAFNQEGSIVYITDSAAMSTPVDPQYGHPGRTFNATQRRTVYAFDVSGDGTHAYNERPIYMASGFVPDGLEVAANGYIMAGVGQGVDILDPSGQLLLTIQTNYTVQNFAWTGPELKALWLWELVGQELR
ncbi:hypothetical protein BDV23DRAFT_169828 [Aspergillus alliaceus]|uniref:SMP-30/Gluconolactonase/LRE-like region domain-containing protein n=1 Tax=Petromyces alliaceus TaxID=209559 RepID=A0A5N7CIC4_PETAA|nr:hypothetical protein BDV23DRAFT_169828 [Aspergillus alliaceus]